MHGFAKGQDGQSVRKIDANMLSDNVAVTSRSHLSYNLIAMLSFNHYIIKNRDFVSKFCMHVRLRVGKLMPLAGINRFFTLVKTG